MCLSLQLCGRLGGRICILVSAAVRHCSAPSLDCSGCPSPARVPDTARREHVSSHVASVRVPALPVAMDYGRCFRLASSSDGNFVGFLSTSVAVLLEADWQSDCVEDMVFGVRGFGYLYAPDHW